MKSPSNHDRRDCLKPGPGSEIRSMKPIVRSTATSRLPATLMGLLLAWPLSAAATGTATLEPNDRHAKISRLVTTLFEHSHYSQVRIDDDVSSKILDRYI